MSLIVRPLHATDEARWRDLWDQYCVFYEQDVSQDVTDASWRRILAGEDGFFARVAEQDGQVIGFANCIVHGITWAVAPVCYLEDLFVDPAVRGGGIGRALIQEVIDMAKAKGWDRVYWKTNASNAVAQVLYNKVATRTQSVVYEVNLG